MEAVVGCAPGKTPRLVLELGGVRLELSDAGQLVLAAQLIKSPATAMLGFSSSLGIHVAVEPCDMRMGFNGLRGAVADKLKGNVREGALFVLTNKRRTRLEGALF